MRSSVIPDTVGDCSSPGSLGWADLDCGYSITLICEGEPLLKTLGRIGYQ